MALMRTRSRIANPAPPPSPIPTAKGSRSASNEILAQFLDNTLHIPDLTLPASHFPETPASRLRRQPATPVDVDLRSLLSSSGSIDRLLGSAKEFGAFLIRGHGVSVDELRSLVREADWALLGNSENPRGFVVRRNGDREEMVWIRNGNERMESLQQVERYRDFSEKMDSIANKLDAIAEQLSQVFYTNAEKQPSQKIIQGKEIALSLYRYNHQNSMEQNPALHDEIQKELFEHALSLHLPIEPCEFHIQSEAGPLTFNAGTETIIVTVGKQLEEWSNKEFKSVTGITTFSPHINGSQPSFSIELRFSTSSLKNVVERNFKTISIVDQIIIAIMFALVYKFFVFISSLITGT
ncbi:hypothetical protein FEM48_Zijuj11G0122400 [Ziziphus jujuba var. spinosa]|uniref:Non-haem dioxygenase N-terminal domain-containing protein n=1 Tax=Ziziphus jujuba var. spinosa TaxID=714518 RepID=A0A978UIV7_ZIZJJ|nr:hypothetical protein FEM48_Zijuj11G0122400 [Ziziphus jujuba var. spinosa]